jgi:peptide deformylase
MAVRQILRMGDPRLLQVSAAVTDFDTPALHALVSDMLETMAAANGAGLAAPQIGEPVRLVIFGGAPSPRYPDAETVPATVLINPLLEPLGVEQEDDWEGCLSVPGLRGRVPRYTALRYAGFDARGERFERTVSGFHARVVQHEVDHLDGILYPQRMRDLRAFGFTEELFPGQVLRDD